MPMKGLKAKSSSMDAYKPPVRESPLEAQTRQDGNFADVESLLPKRFRRTEMGLIDKGTGMSGFPITCHRQPINMMK